MKTRYVQYTKGFDAEGIVAPAVAYTNQATYPLFVTNAVEGAVGVYNSQTQALVTAALAANTEFFVAIKRTGLPDAMTKLKYDNTLAITKTVGVAPNSQVTTVVISCGGTTECRSCNCCADALVDYQIGILDTQTNDYQLESWNYDLSGKSGRTIAQLLAGMRTMINDANGFTNVVRNGQVVNMSAITTVPGDNTTPTTYTFTLTGVGTLVNKAFKVTAKGFCNINITYTTLASEGVNVIEDITEHDRENLLREGWGTETPGYPFVSGDFGAQTQFSNGQTGVFTQYKFEHIRHEDSTVKERHFRRHIQTLEVPTGSALETSLNTIFAV